jgi:hypothetical protein
MSGSNLCRINEYHDSGFLSLESTTDVVIPKNAMVSFQILSDPPFRNQPIIQRCVSVSVSKNTVKSTHKLLLILPLQTSLPVGKIANSGSSLLYVSIRRPFYKTIVSVFSVTPE